jgi:hypothetical protein
MLVDLSALQARCHLTLKALRLGRGQVAVHYTESCAATASGLSLEPGPLKAHP